MNHLEQPLVERRNDGSCFLQASVISSSIEEEDFVDNIQPNLVSSISTDSYSSHVNSNELDQPDWDEFPTATTLKPVSESKHNAQGVTTKSTTPKPKLSLSMHDISTIPTYPLTSTCINLSTSTIQSQSMTTDASLPKSKDSGLPRSLSCVSLNSSKNYGHVQSKVKEYIKQIKECKGSKRKLNFKVDSAATSCQTEEFSQEESVSAKALIPLIDQLKDELEDKDKMLLKLQENYDTLLMRYAAAENRIDHLRLNSADTASRSPFNFDLDDYKKPKASPNVLLLSELENIRRESHSEQKKAARIKQDNKSRLNVLSPITKFYSNSVRLDKLEVQPLPSTAESSTKNFKCWDDRESVKTSVKELSPERLNQQVAENPYSKVKRWQESLPSFELIEPTSYEGHCMKLSTSQMSKCSLDADDVSDSFKQTPQCTNVSVSYTRSKSQIDFSVDDLASARQNPLKSWLSLSSIQSSTSLEYDLDQHLIPTFNQDGLSLPAKTSPAHKSSPLFQAASLQKSQTSPSVVQAATPKHRNLGLTETSHTRRKKLLGQKARHILFEYLKSSKPESFALTKLSRGKTAVERSISVDSFDDYSLGQCLEEMNDCARNLKGKSEAIMEVLAKQLKES